MSISNQKEYWNGVAQVKTFTHPINLPLLEKYAGKESAILDFGCGYGRIVQLLADAGYKNTSGYDTSEELINRGRKNGNANLFAINNPADLPVADNSADCILLFAVLTCIPDNKGQKALIKLLHSKLKPGGIIYISDYYLQESTAEVSRYQYLNDDKENYGVFSLLEGAVFRHHTKEWISLLLKDFTILVEDSISVTTMNGHAASGFQVIGRR